jgi:hypothetical protein
MITPFQVPNASCYKRPIPLWSLEKQGTLTTRAAASFSLSLRESRERVAAALTSQSRACWPLRTKHVHIPCQSPRAKHSRPPRCHGHLRELAECPASRIPIRCPSRRRDLPVPRSRWRGRTHGRHAVDGCVGARSLGDGA